MRRTEVMTSQKSSFAFQRFEYHTSEEHDENPKVQICLESVYGARDMAA